jgi:hypothetical protein
MHPLRRGGGLKRDIVAFVLIIEYQGECAIHIRTSCAREAPSAKQASEEFMECSFDACCVVRRTITHLHHTMVPISSGAVTAFAVAAAFTAVGAVSPTIKPEFVDGQVVYSVSEVHEFNSASALAVEWDQSFGQWTGSPPGAFNNANVQTGLDKQFLALTAKKQVGFWPDFDDALGPDECSCLDEISTGYLLSLTCIHF